MIFIIIVHLFCVFIDSTEQQDQQCPGDFPFRLVDNACASFSGICYKKGDANCDQLQNACKQCPPSNITSIILQDMLKFVKINMSIKLENMENKIKIQSQLITNNSEKMINVSSRLEIMGKKMENGFQYFFYGINVILIIIILLLLAEIRYKLIIKCFQRCCGKAKKKIERIEFKSEKLKDERMALTSKEVKGKSKCQILHSRKSYMLEKMNERIEINSIKLEDIKMKIDTILKEFPSQFTKLQLESSGEDGIRIVTKEAGKLVIKSIFDDDDCITVEYANTDLVSSLTTSVANKKSSTPQNIVLFYDNKCLDERKSIFENRISNEIPIKFCYFMKWSGIEINEGYIEKGNFSELRYGKYKNKKGKEILIKKYEVLSSKNWKDEEFMLKELVAFQITKSHTRFIQLLGVYYEDTSLYVVMENMAGGTMKTFLKENYAKLQKNKIYNWLSQILEGLKFLHKQKIIHRNLNPSSILVDDKNDLKLSSFNLSKYLDISKPSSVMAKYDKKVELPVRYMAPEILESDKCGMECDVWSFGAVLIRIVTNKCPYPDLNKNQVLVKIAKFHSIEYELPTEYSEFRSIIDSCLKSKPNKRETIDKLIENVGKYIEN